MTRNLSKPVVRRTRIGALILSVALAACDRSASGDTARSAYVDTDSMGVQPAAVSTVPLHARPELLENSVAVMSRSQPGVFYSMNDSDNEPLVFALDTTGHDRGLWRVTNATNIDWESASLGPCGAAQRATTCVYIGDTGDNESVYPTRAIYRAAEPSAAQSAGFNGRFAAEKLTYTYADGPHDVEAMYVAPNGDMVFIAKSSAARSRRPPSPRAGVSPARERVERDQAVAELTDSLSIVPGSAPLRVVTDASLSPDGRHLAVRTYGQVFVYATDSLTGRVDHSIAPAICNIVSLGEAQGEGISWVDDRGRFIFTSEGGASPLMIASCPLPSRSRAWRGPDWGLGSAGLGSGRASWGLGVGLSSADQCTIADTARQ